MNKNFSIIFISFLLALFMFLVLPYQEKAQAINRVSNWDFASSGTGWITTNGSGTNVCGDTGSTSETNMSTLAYTGSLGNPAGAFQAVTAINNNTNFRANINQTITAPGSGAVIMKGRLDYYANGSSWSPKANSSWIRIDIYDSSNSTFVSTVGCVSFNTNQSWTTMSFSSDTSLTGGTTYTVRITMRSRTSNTKSSNTLAVDNIVINFAPTGLSSNTPENTTYVDLNWSQVATASGSLGLATSNPYKVYRSISTPVTTSNFLAYSQQISYGDTSTDGNTTYYYSISDIDSNSIESPLSAETSRLTRPGAPTSLNFTNVNMNTLRLNWTAPTGGAGTGYKVERCSGSGCSDFLEIESGTINTYYDDSGLLAQTLYRYRVRAYNATGNGVYSSIAEVTTPLVAISLTTDGIVDYGVIAPSASNDTLLLSDTQTVKNDGDIAIDLNIKTSNAIGGTDWTIGSSPGTNIFVHEFSITGGSSWTKFSSADSYQTLTTNVLATNTQSFDLKITAPNSSSDYTQKTVNITIQAVAP